MGLASTAALGAALVLQPGRPTVIPLMFPVMVAAYIGGLWSGLVTAIPANAIALWVISLDHPLSLAHDLERVGSMFVVTATIAIASEALHRARRRAEHAAALARASEARFAQIFNASPVAKALSRLDDGEVIDVNPAYLELFQIKREQIVGQTPRAAGISPDSATRMKLFDALHTDGQLHEEEATIVTTAGVERMLLLSSQVILLDDTRVALSTFVDLSERKRAEAIAREADARLREFAAHIDSAFFLVDVRIGCMLYVSPGYERLWGRTVAQHMANPLDWLEGVHPDDRVRKSDEIRNLETAHATEYRIVRPDGEVRWVHTRLSPIRDERGKVFQVAGISEDITGRRDAEQAAHESEQRLAQIASSINECVWMTDARTDNILYLSPAYQKIWGRVAGVTMWLDTIHPDDREWMVTMVRDSKHEGFDARYRIVRPDGDIRWIRDRAFPIRDKAGAVIRFAGVAEDITDQLRVDEKLLQGQKLESIGLLAGGVAHDFNNILCVITANVEMLAESMPVGHPDRQLVDEIDCAADRARSLTQQLLAFSRKQVTQAAVLALNTIVEDTRKLLRRMLGEEIVVKLVLDAETPPVRVDAGQIAQVLMNLCVNARDAMAPGGGTITIETRAVPGGAMLLVNDTGPGMPDEIKARAFEPFFTTKEVGKGTGLGLAVVHGIVTQAGGAVEIDSRPGAGTSIRMRLPAAPDARIHPSALRRAVGRGSERILLVDDDGPLRTTSARALSLRGYDVVEASDGNDALRVLRADRTKIDLLITDVVMPSMNGRELAEAAVGELPNLRVLFTSGYPDDDIMRRGIQQAQVAFLEKPFGATALALKVREVLDVNPR